MKKFIYIVTWCITYAVQVPCPDMPKKDEFGRLEYGTACSVYHFRIEKDCDGLEKYFAVRDSAVSFINRASKEVDVLGEGVADIRFDSIMIK